MDIKTAEGLDIYVLPENAVCLESKQNPLNTDKCPLCCFDVYGDCCIPELCERYTEEQNAGEELTNEKLKELAERFSDSIPGPYDNRMD